MSRQSILPSRSLSLTEELERLEQSITLTLQEIDHNFSRAHRIVTSSVIPIVEQYAKHSDDVWEGSKFWKQFFEASANVSLSSYEEPQEEDLTAMGQEQADQDQTEQATPTQVAVDDSVTTTEEHPAPSSRLQEDIEASSILDSPSVTVAMKGTPQRQSNGRQPSAKQGSTSRDRETSFAQYPSPYETLKAELKSSQRSQASSKRPAPITPGRSQQLSAQTPFSSSPAPIPPSTSRRAAPSGTANATSDPLLHRILDRNYRVQATPHTARAKPLHSTAQPTSKSQTQTTANPALDSSPFSPAPAAPQLRAEIFGSPVARGRARAAGPRTPGVSVQKATRGGRAQRTPAPGSARKTLFSPAARSQAATQRRGQGAASRMPADRDVFDDDSFLDSDTSLDMDLGMSPPKTMQFHIPASRMVQTPAREASRRIVEDLMRTAGLPESDDEGMEGEMDRLDLTLDEDSPSMVRVRRGVGGEEEF